MTFRVFHDPYKPWISLSRESLHTRPVAQQAGAYLGFCSIKWLGVFLLPPGWDAYPSQSHPPALNLPVLIYTSGTHSIKPSSLRLLGPQPTSFSRSLSLFCPTLHPTPCWGRREIPGMRCPHHLVTVFWTQLPVVFIHSYLTSTCPITTHSVTTGATPTACRNTRTHCDSIHENNHYTK